MTGPETQPAEAPLRGAVGHEPWENLEALLRESGPTLDWRSPFLLPGWMQAWRQAFAPESTPWIVSMRDHGRLIGVAALLRDEAAARLVGSADVCDHLDIVTSFERGREFCGTLLATLRRDGITRLDLGPVRPDSAVMTQLLPEARRMGFQVAVTHEDVLFELDLPASWERYLERLSGKQRHEIRRKLRRLERTAPFAFRMAAATCGMDQFVKLFRRNRTDKARFMDTAMEGYFRSLAERLPETRLGFLDIDGVPAAAVMCVDHRRTRYLYNSGFDAALNHLSVGILCKVLSIRDAVARGLKTYDFLKGEETYKRQLGGRPVALHRCRIDFPD